MCAMIEKLRMRRVGVGMGCGAGGRLHADRVQRSAALPRGAHRGRVWEPSQGSHEGRSRAAERGNAPPRAERPARGPRGAELIAGGVGNPPRVPMKKAGRLTPALDFESELAGEVVALLLEHEVDASPDVLGHDRKSPRLNSS